KTLDDALAQLPPDCPHDALLLARGAGLIDIGNTDAAHEVLDTALALSTARGDPIARARCHAELAMACRDDSRIEEARERLARAIALFRHAGDRYGEMLHLGDLGMLGFAQGDDYDQAILHVTASLKLARELAVLLEVGSSLNNLGTIHRELENHE